MANARITFASGDAVDVQGDLQEITDELHKVVTRREHTFAVFQDLDGNPVAVRPEAVAHVRPDPGASAAGP